MGKVVIQEFMTLDGVVEDPGGETSYEHGGWAVPYVDDDQLRWVTEMARKSEALLLGRRTYEGFVRAWPGRTGMQGLADRMNEMPKHVVSSTLTETTWNATRIDVDDIAALRERATGPLAVIGSVSLAKALIRADLVDEYWLWIVPVLVGAGERLFDERTPPRPLRLAEQRRTGSGQAVMTYARA
jgi:dihydrofolate reductase